MTITDSQVHIWGENTPERPWPVLAAFRQPPRPTALGADELMDEMKAAGVDRAVLVPPSWEGHRNDVALKACADYPGRFGVMGRVNLKAPDAVDFTKWLDQPGMLGVRISFFKPDEFEWLTDGTAEWFWEVAEELNIPVMVFAPLQTPAVGDVAKRHPGLRLILDHLNLDVPLRDEPLWNEFALLAPLAQYANLAVKVSALPSYVTDEYPYHSLDRFISTIVKEYGADRCMWGSDLSRLRGTYGEWVRTITEAADYLSESDKELLLGGAIEKWLDWPVAAELA